MYTLIKLYLLSSARALAARCAGRHDRAGLSISPRPAGSGGLPLCGAFIVSAHIHGTRYTGMRQGAALSSLETIYTSASRQAMERAPREHGARLATPRRSTGPSRRRAERLTASKRRRRARHARAGGIAARWSCASQRPRSHRDRGARARARACAVAAAYCMPPPCICACCFARTAQACDTSAIASR